MRRKMFVEDFITGFVKNILGRRTREGCWSVIEEGDIRVLTYTPSDQPEEVERVAYRFPDGTVLSNANQLEYVGRRFAWGRETTRWGRGRQAVEQQWMEQAGAVPFPFTLFSETGMNVRDFSWIIKPKSENVSVIIPPRYPNEKAGNERRHFSGACLFAIGEDTFLFDVDRKELDHGIFNPFVTKLPRRVETIEEAYDSLMPDEIKTAISSGTEVLRQGEFFFVKYSDECPIKPDLTDEEREILKFQPSRVGFGIGSPNTKNWRNSYDDNQPYRDNSVTKTPAVLDTPEKISFQKAALRYEKVLNKYRSNSPLSGELGKSATGSHKVEQYIEIDGIKYASGVVKHNRREHDDLPLKGWYKVVENNGLMSWTIRGDID
jgi:hypothetical protein